MVDEATTHTCMYVRMSCLVHVSVNVIKLHHYTVSCKLRRDSVVNEKTVNMHDTTTLFCDHTHNIIVHVSINLFYWWSKLGSLLLTKNFTILMPERMYNKINSYM